jgi:hypothetical protein
MKLSIPALVTLFLCACSPSDLEPAAGGSASRQCVRLCATDYNPCDPMVFKTADRRCDIDF